MSYDSNELDQTKENSYSDYLSDNLSWLNLDDSEFSDLQLKVDQPQKHVTNMETFVTYRILTKTTRGNFSNSEFCVRRRYNDFVWLRAALVSENPANIIPVLPEKHNLIEQLDRYQRQFVLSRMFLLNKFLTRLAKHHVLTNSAVFHTFVTASTSEFSVYKSHAQTRSPNLYSSLQELSVDMSLALGTRQRRLVRPLELDTAVTYICAHTRHVSLLERVLREQHKVHRSLVTVCDSCHSAMSLWASAETSSEWVHIALLTVAEAFRTCGTAASTWLLATMSRHVTESLHEHALTSCSVLEAVRRRDHLHVQYLDTDDTIHRCVDQRHELLNGNVPSGFSWMLSRLYKSSLASEADNLSYKIARLIEQREDYNSQLEKTDMVLISDWSQWRMEEERRLRHIISVMAQCYIQFYQECYDAWNTVLCLLVNNDEHFISS